MMPPLLVLVEAALQPRLEPLPHVPQLINTYLIPATIDAAMYNDLQLVVDKYEACRPCTVRAMDVAAARGRLDILRSLRARRAVGCSSTAFVGAAANGHRVVLDWLYHNYQELRDPGRDIIRGAVNGQASVVESLLVYPLEDFVALALEAAAGAGQVAIVDMLAEEAGSAFDAFDIAARKGQVEVLRLLLEKWRFDCDPTAALNHAIMSGSVNVVEFLAEYGDIAEESLGSALKMAAKNGLCDMVALLLDKSPGYTTNSTGGSSIARLRKDTTIASALFDAAKAAHLEVVEAMAIRIGSSAAYALREATLKQQWTIVKALLQNCDVEDLEYVDTQATIRRAVECAAVDGDVELGQLLIDKFGDFDIGSALKDAIINGQVEIVKLLMANVTLCREVHLAAFVTAALHDRFTIMEILLWHSNESTMEEACARIGCLGKIELMKWMLKKCDDKASERIFADAAVNGRVNLLQALVSEVDALSVRRALICAAARGNIQTVRTLKDKCDAQTNMISLEVATMEKQLAVVDLLSGQCDAVGIDAAMAKATALGYGDVVALLHKKKRRLE